MPAVETFSFSGYLLRPTDEGDLRLATEWTEADPHHRDTTNPSFWLEQSQISDSYLLENNHDPIFFFKMMRTSEAHVVELHIQFPPPPAYHVSQNFRNRQMIALLLGFDWIERMLYFSGVTEVFFMTHNPTLARFCTKRLGFDGTRARLTKLIAAPGKGNGVCAEPLVSRRN